LSEKERYEGLLLLTRTIKYDAKGNKISDTITNHLTGETSKIAEGGLTRHE